MNLDTIEGTVDAEVYHSPESGWTVMKARAQREDGSIGEVGIVGVLQSSVGRGANFIARGQWADSKYGRQFKFEVLTVKAPTTADQITARLVTYPGIGDAMAAKIVARFGDCTWEVMDSAISSLGQVRGIGPRGLAKIVEHHATQHGPVAKIQHRLIELQAPPRLAMAIHKEFGADALDTLENHPYKVAAKVERFGFKLAEQIGRAIGLDPESDERIDAGIIHEFMEAQSQGHCALPHAELTRKASKLLMLRPGIVDAGSTRMLAAKALSYEPGRLYLRHMHWVEGAVGHSVARLATSEHPAWAVGDLPDNLSQGQREAVEAVARGGFVILTGGPGTGKSTVLLHVTKVAEREKSHVILCAPTGRAAKRMSETTGLEAKTIHRLLGMNPGTMSFRHDRSNPLPAGLLVVDESSMLDVKLAQALFDALTSDHRVLLVGDADQLPSVGPGNVLRDMIQAADETGKIPVVRLTTVFRQAEGSTIIKNAHRILAGDDLAPDPASRGSESEFLVLSTPGEARTHEKIIEMASVRIPKAYGLDRMSEVQILCPMNSKTAGMVRTDAFNESLQRLYTAKGEGFGTKRGDQYYLGDRVMVTRNDYNRNVFNGDLGTVVSIGSTFMTIDVDGVMADYERKDLGPIRLAYAMTIHKSQGSEFPAVLVPILGCHSVMLRRNLLYTAITRASRLCVIVGDPRAIRQAIESADAAQRWTGLAPRLMSALGHDSRKPRLVVVA